jgi:hypothetical protein
VITLELIPQSGSTLVDVVYERTALGQAANATVQEMALRDRLAGEEWSRQINEYLRR